MSISLVQRVEHWSQVAPDSVAHESGERAITYRELHERSCALAGHLNSTIGKDRSPIAIVGHKEPELLIGFIACARAGHPYIPIDRSTPPDRTQRILETAGPRLVLDPESIREHALSSESPPDGDVDELDPYYVIFTSGSTGDPKGVVITHGCLSTFIEWMMSDFEWNVGAERILNQAPFSFDLSVMDLSIALATSSTLVSVTADQIGNPKLLFQVLEKSDLTIWVSTPSFAQMCLTERGFSASMLPGLRRFLFCGETLANDVAAELLRRFPDAEVWNTYGPTEATVAVTSVRVTSELLAQHPVLPVGRPMPATRLLIHDEHGLSVHPGERGEIVIAGPSVSIGYLGAPELTERSFTRIDGQRAYRTGDWGRLQDGMLFFDGRRDGQIKLHGYRIELGDIEANLRQLEDVRDAAVLPVEHDGQVDSLTAFVVATAPVVESSFRASRAIQTALSSRLPAYMVPRRIRFLDSLPMTANGKADRARLKELLQ